MSATRALAGATGLILLAAAAGAPAETTTYTGSATYTAHRELLPLSNGGAAVHVTNRVVGTISPSDSGGFIFGDCAGLAYLSPEGEVSIDNICTFREDDENAFTLRGKAGIEGGESTIVGGTGKWAGATGSGKSTSLAALIDYRNANSSGHIVTVEDPIEYVHTHKKCIVNQREVGVDTRNWHNALKNTLRQAPDVILIGEIRDPADLIGAPVGMLDTVDDDITTVLESQLGVGWSRVGSRGELHLRALWETQFWLNDTFADDALGFASNLGLGGVTIGAEFRR